MNPENVRKSGAMNQGFTLVEVSIVVFILGVVLFLGGLSFAGSRNAINLSAASKQVQAAIERAKTAARQENVEYVLIFYPSTAGHPNSFEFEHNEPDGLGGWLLVPVDGSVSDENVTQDSGHWYIKVNGVNITGSQVTLQFRPAGTQISITGGTITLQAGSATKQVSIDSQGKITTS
jgi:prepilin-type N-terminal cleavage/methylation domain-containing protein